VIAEIGGRYVILKLRALRVLGEGDEQLFREVKEPLQLVLELFVSLEPFLLHLLRRLCVKHVGEAGRNQVIVSSERLRLLLVVMVGGFSVAAVVGAEDVGFRVLLLLLILVVVRAWRS
jgi:hypothetical protein